MVVQGAHTLITAVKVFKADSSENFAYKNSSKI